MGWDLATRGRFSETLVNEVRFAWTGINLLSNATQALNPIIPGSLGAGINSSIPQFNLTGFATIGAQASCCTNTPLHKTVGVWDFSDNVSKNVHKHTLKTGGELMLIRPSTEAALNGRGVFGFTGVFSQNPQSRSGTGSAVADFLLGTANTLTTGSILQDVEREWYIGGYLQDDWSVTSALTLNIGLRYEYLSPAIETNNRMANFIETPGDPNFGSYVLAGDPRYPRSLVSTSKLGFAPRVGFAYRVPKVANLVVRGSFGIFYAQDNGLGVSAFLTANPPFYSYGGLSIVSDQGASHQRLRGGSRGHHHHAAAYSSQPIRTGPDRDHGLAKLGNPHDHSLRAGVEPHGGETASLEHGLEYDLRRQHRRSQLG